MPKPTAAKASLLQPGDRFLNTDEAAQFLGTTNPTMNYWRTIGNGPKFYRQGRNVRYLLSDLVTWGTARCVDPQRERLSA
jgi:predicted DNA-binding transcriptional regulator AlpA